MNKRRLLFILSNIFIATTTVAAVIVVEIYGSRAGRLDNNGFPFWQNIVTFTVLSNIYLAVVAAIATIYNIFHKSSPLPRWLTTLYLSAVSSALITFFTVILYLAPARALSGRNYFDMLLEPMFFLHFFNPVLSAVIYIFFMDGAKLPLKSRLLALIPFVIYAIIYLVFVVILKICPDFYGLTFGGHYYLTPLVFIGFIAVDFGIATMLNTLQCKYLAHLK